MSAVSIVPRGRNFVRSVMLRSLGGAETDDMREIAAQHWGAHNSESIVRAAVTAFSAGDAGIDPVATEFMDLVREQSIYGRLAGLRKVPFRRRMIRLTNSATAYWVGEAKPKPISKPSVIGSTLEPAKVVSIIVLTDEALKFGGKVTESALQDDLTRALIGSWDEAFIDVSNAGEEGVRPASVTNGAPAVAATADPAADLAALIEAFEGDFGSAFFVTDPTTAMQLAMRRAGTAFEFPDVGPRGGSVLGIPVLTSRASPRTTGGQIALIDPTGISAADETLAVQPATHATVQMVDDPEGSEVEHVSLWQNNLAAFKGEVFTNWEVQRPGAVAVITGANYPAGA